MSSAGFSIVSGGTSVFVEDAHATVRWYVEAIAFTVQRDYISGDKLVYAHVGRDSGSVLVMDHLSYVRAGYLHKDFPLGIAEVRFETRGLRFLAQELSERGIDHETEDDSGTVSLGVKDPDGNRIVFFESS